MLHAGKVGRSKKRVSVGVGPLAKRDSGGGKGTREIPAVLVTF